MTRAAHVTAHVAALVALGGVGCGEPRRELANAPTTVASDGAAPPTGSGPPTSSSASRPPTCACAPEETCLDGGCVTLPPGLEAANLRAFGRRGLWNAWSTVAPLHRGAVEKLQGAAVDLEPVGGDAAAKATCEPSGWVGAQGKGADRWSAHLAYVVATHPVEADLWASTLGALEVRIGDAPAASFTEPDGGERPALLDEGVARVHLPRGVTPVLALHERPDGRSGGFYLRLRDPKGGFPAGVRIAERVAAARCDAGTLVAPHLKVTPLPTEPPTFRLDLAPTFEGLVPASPEALTFLAQLRKKKPEPTASAPVTATDMARATARVSLVVPAPERGEGTLVVLAQGGAEPVAEARVRALPKELHGRVARAEARVADLPASLGRPSLEHHARVLVQAVASGEKDTAWLEEHTRRLEALLEAATGGRDPYAAARGVVFRAYRSAVDGQLQPYVAFVPSSIDRSAPLPLVLVAHGMDRLPEHALRTLIGQAPDDHMTLGWAARHLPRFPDQRAILVAPWQFGNAGPHALGDADLDAVIADVSATWSVDAARVSITGYSLGGTVSFVAPLHMPGRFSAAAPLCGYPNLMDYRSVSRVDKTAWEPAMLAKEYIVGLAENGLHLPLHVVHGENDGPGRSKVVVDRWRELGQSVVWDLVEDAGHNVWDHAYEDGHMVSWLTRHRRPPAPRHVRLRTGEYRVDRAFWLQVTGLEDAASTTLAAIDASFEPATSTLTATTRGVTAFEVDRTGLPDAQGAAADPGSLHVLVDGHDLGTSEKGRPVVVAWEGGKATLRDTAPDRTGKKHHGVSGPLEDALHHPLMIVTGTADPAMSEANRLVAEHVATAFGTAELQLPILADVETTVASLQGKSVILVGGPSSNLLSRRWQAALPARFEPGAITVRGKRYEGGDLAVSAIAPRPDDPEQYVVLHAGLSEAGTLAARHLPRYLPDWVVYDARIRSARGGLLFGPRPTVDGGFFDDSWR